MQKRNTIHFILLSTESVFMCFPLDPAVTLDVWRRINQLSDPHSRQLTLLWTPVNNAVFLRKTCDGAFLLREAFVFSVFPARLQTWSSEVTWWSGHRTQSGAAGGAVETPRRSSPLAQDGMTSPSVLLSTRAPTSLPTSPSLRGTTEVEVSWCAGQTRWISQFDVIIVKLSFASLHRNPPSFEAAVWRRSCCLQPVLGQTGNCHLWLYGGVVRPRRQRSLRPAMGEGASRKQHAVSTCWYVVFFLQWSSRRKIIFHGFDPHTVLFCREFQSWPQVYI